MAVGARKKRYKEIQDFMDNRMIRNSDFFSSNTKIVGAYKFHKKVVDNLVNDTYNVIEKFETFVESGTFDRMFRS